MTDKIYREVVPYGILKVEGNVYWLLSPQPLLPDSWQHAQQQMWSVVPFVAIEMEIDVPKYNYARTVVCSNPLIEYRNYNDCNSISVLQLFAKNELEDLYQEYNVTDEEFPPEPEYIAEMNRAFLEGIGAIISPDDQEGIYGNS